MSLPPRTVLLMSNMELVCQSISVLSLLDWELHHTFAEYTQHPLCYFRLEFVC